MGGVIVTLAGDLGSGKTSVAKELSKALGYRYLSTGSIHRDIADELGMNSLQLNFHAEGNPEIDRRVDSVLINLADEGVNYVVDSRVAWHFVRSSLKVYLKVDKDVGSERVMSDTVRLNEPQYRDVHDAKDQLQARRESENRRFLAQYGIDCSDLRNYDIVVDSTLLTRLQVVDTLLELIERWLNDKPVNKYWTSPRLLFPTEHVRELASDGAVELRSRIEREGFNGDYPVEIVEGREGFCFIWDGHKRTSAALFATIPAIPVFIVARTSERVPTGETAEEFGRAVVNLSWYYDWEDVHEFRFIKYPAPQKD